MRKYQYIITCIIFFISFTLYSQTMRRESYIDIPSAKFNKGLFFNLNGSFPVNSENEVSTDINSGLEFAINRFNAIINCYSTSDFSLDLSYLLFEQNGVMPNLSFGIDNITYRQYISPIGGDTQNTYSDERYVPRPPELASTYLAATRKFSENFEITIGVGRGRFIGYGPRSRNLNLDIFFDEKHEKYTFGFFGGIKFSIPNGPSLIIESDGRDANLGLQYEYGIFKGTLSIIKLEQFASVEGSHLTPRININFSFRALSFEGPENAIVNINLRDQFTDKPIAGILTYGDGKLTSVNISITGKKTLRIKPGTYLFTLSSPEYKMKQAKLPLRPGQELNLTIKLEKKMTPDMESSIELTRLASKDYKNKNYLEAKDKLEKALNLYPENEKAEEGLTLVLKAIKEKVNSLKEEALSLESVNLSRAISLWQEVLNWEQSRDTEAHIQDLRNRLTSLTKPKPAKKPTPVKKKPSLSTAQIEDLYKKGITEYVKGNYREAVNYFQRILNANPNHEGAKRYLNKAKEKL